MKICFNYFILIIILIYNFKFYLNQNSIFKNIVINDYSNTSQTFIYSVNLYNKRLININKIYKSINKCSGNKKAVVVLIFYAHIKKFIDANYIFLKQKFHDKLIFYVTENITLSEQYRRIKYNVIDITPIFFSFPFRFNESI